MSRARLLLATFAAYLPAAALPAIAGPHDPALLVVPFCLGFAIGFSAWGRATDRREPEQIIRAALLLTAAAGLLVAFASTGPLLALGRLVQGLAAAGIPPAVQAALHLRVHLHPTRHRHHRARLDADLLARVDGGAHDGEGGVVTDLEVH